MSVHVSHGLLMADYHAIPALSAGGAWTLSEKCPALYWHRSPINPSCDWERMARSEFDIGTAAHAALLEPDQYAERIVEVPFSTYHTAEARQLREAAYATGRVPLKPNEIKIVDGIRRSFESDREISALLKGGEAEVSIEWEIHPGVPAKCRPDYITGTKIIDVKTTESAHKRSAGMAAVRDGWHLRAAWYLEGVLAASDFLGISGRPIEALSYQFLCIEKTPPYLMEVYELTPRAIAWGQRIMSRAIQIFCACSAANRWPNYNNSTVTQLDLPTFAEYQLAEREEFGDFSEFLVP